MAEIDAGPTPHKNILKVVVWAGDFLFAEYVAYAVRGLSLEEYLLSKEEKQKASWFANGRFAFPELGHEENFRAYHYSDYAYEVQQHRGHDYATDL